MEKRQLMKNLLFLFLLIPACVFGQNATQDISMNNDISIDNGRIIDLDKEGDLLIIPGEDCHASTQVSVKLAHLEQFGPNQYGIPLKSIGEEDLEGFSLFLHYHIGSEQGVMELDNTFEPLPSVIGGIQIYEKVFYIPIDITEAMVSCSSSPLNFDFRFVDELGLPVPLHLFSGGNQIFDCTWFIDGPCYNPPFAVWSGELKSKEYCELCADDGSNDGDDSDDDEIEHNIHKESGSTNMFFPNPFGESTKLELTLVEDSTVEVAIYDATGKIAIHWKEDVSKGVYSKVLTTSEWKNGVYFGKIRTGNKVENIQMIKID